VTEAADARTVELRKRTRDDQHGAAAARRHAKNKDNSVGAVSVAASAAATAFELLDAAATVTREKNVAVDDEIRAFAGLVMDVRAQFRHDCDGNEGYVVARRLRGGATVAGDQGEGSSSAYPPGTSLKCVVHCGGSTRAKRKSAFNFTCDCKLNILIKKVICLT